MKNKIFIKEEFKVIKNTKLTLRKAMALFLAMLMLATILPFQAFAALDGENWTYIPGKVDKFEPVAVYVQTSTLTSGQTYLLSYTTSTAMAANGTGLKDASISRKDAATTSYYTSDSGSTIFTAENYYIVDETNTALTGAEFVFSGSSNTQGTFKNASTGTFINRNNTTAGLNSSSTTLTYGSGRLYVRSGYSTYRLRRTGTNAYAFGTSTSGAYVTLYQKRTVYKKVSETIPGAFYKYNAQNSFVFDMNTEYDNSIVENTVSILVKEEEESETYSLIKLNDPSVTIDWVKPVDINTVGEYEARVYVYGNLIETIKVTVVEEGAVLIGKDTDPSTNDIRNQFNGTSADDGKVATDKTVADSSDAFGAFSNYTEDEFSIALSALGQSYTVVETEETTIEKRIHPDVIFVIDESGSMRQYTVAGSTTVTRGEATATALNGAIKSLYEADPETRIGIVSFSHQYNELGVYLPLDKYTLPEGQTDYILWGGRSVLSTDSSEIINKKIASTTLSTNSSYYKYYYPSNNNFSSSTTGNGTTSLARYQFSSSARIRLYAAGSSTSYTTISSGLADGAFIVNDGYVFYRSGNTIYVAEESEVFGYEYAYDYRQVSASATKTLNTGTTASNSTSANLGVPSGVTPTTIATVNGVTYRGYAYVYSNNNYQVDFIFRDGVEGYIAYLTSSSPTYEDENIKITRNTSNAQVTYQTYEYEKFNLKPSIAFEEVDNMMSTNFLINSNGEVVKPSSYKFITGMGTYTQAGIKAAENMFETYATGDLSDRVPAVVLISDGIPTVGSSDTANPPLYPTKNKTTGIGTHTGDTTSSDALTNYGLYTIETGVISKENATQHYKDHGSTRDPIFYAIGPGVDYILGKTILDPSEEHMQEAARTTTAGGDEAGIGVPSELYQKIVNKFGTDAIDFVDFVDWSYTGDMSSSEISDAFQEIVKNITEVTRPISSTSTKTEQQEVFEENAAMIFTDTIGDGMSLSDLPVLRYNHTNFRPTSSDKKTENGLTVETFYYDYKIQEASTSKFYSLSNVAVEVITDANGNQTVKWYIPAELVPIIFRDEETNTFSYCDPIRLIYKVEITDKSHSGTYYANSTEKPANAVYTPVVGNPYYYNNVEGEDGLLHSYLKTDIEKTTDKKSNDTETLTYSNKVTVNDKGEITEYLGNNGVEKLQFTVLSITKVWKDSNDKTGQRPDHISVQVKRNGQDYGGVRDFYEKDCIVTTNEDGDDIWEIVVDGLPYNEKFVYTIDELEIPDHTTYIQTVDKDSVIVNTLIHAKVGYELYLVDENGNPIDDYNNPVTFENREVKSELVEALVYIHTTDTIDFEELSALLPEGYVIYNPDASFTETFEKTAAESSAYISDSTGTTKVFYPENATVSSNGKVNVSDYSEIKVAFAIVKVAQLNPDTVVVDFGLPVKIHVLKNDMGVSNGQVTDIATGVANGTVTETKSYTSSQLTGDIAAQAKKNITLEHGKAYFENDYVVYSLSDMLLDKEEVFYYECTASDGSRYYTTVTAIPAANIYYEDSFITFNDGNGYSWQKAGSEYTDVFQAEDRPGVTNFEGIDADNVYGRDQAYDDETTTYSLGSAMFAEVDAASVNKEPTATFTFCGTGFDFFSCTNSDTGALIVDVTQNGKAVKKSVVQTYYGYSFGQLYFDANGELTHDVTSTPAYYAPDKDKSVVVNGEKMIWATATYYEDDEITLTTVATNKPAYAYGWLTSSQATGLYQVPVIAIRDLPYGTYDVKITPKYSKMFDKNFDANAANNSYKVYVDSVRIYDPAGIEPELGSAVADAYIADGEYIPQYLEIRRRMLTAETFFDSTATLDSDELTAGAVFIDGIADLNSETLGPDAVSDSYLKFGPNNELYLAKGQAVAFYITSDREIVPDSLQLGMKTISGGKTKVLCLNSNQIKATSIDVWGGTEQFRTLTPFIEWDEEQLDNGRFITKYPIILANNSDSVVSLTCFKWTYAQPDYVAKARAMAATMGLDIAVSAATPRLMANALSIALDETDYTEKMLDEGNFEVVWDEETIKENGEATIKVVTPAEITGVTVGDKSFTNCTVDENGNKVWQFTFIISEAGEHSYNIVFEDRNGNVSDPIASTTITVEEEEKAPVVTEPEEKDPDVTDPDVTDPEENDDKPEKPMSKFAALMAKILNFFKKIFTWWK